MPFILRNLAPIGPTASRPPVGVGEATGFGAFGLWSYRTEDAAATVDTSGYFNAAAGLLRNGDIIIRVTINGSGAAQTAGFHLVNQVNAAGVVDTTDVLALTVTDTD
jgi:hypothetical protein